jgi:hypothetical protein
MLVIMALCGDSFSAARVDNYINIIVLIHSWSDNTMTLRYNIYLEKNSNCGTYKAKIMCNLLALNQPCSPLLYNIRPLRIKCLFELTRPTVKFKASNS